MKTPITCKASGTRNERDYLSSRALAGVLAALILTAVSAHSAVLVGYDMSARTTSSPDFQAPATTDAAVTASNLTLSSSLTYSAATGVLIARGFTVAPSSLEAAVTAEDYFAFSLAPTAGNSLSLTSLTYTLRVVEATSPTTTQWAYSLDNINFVALGTALVEPASAATYGNLSVSLSDVLALQDVSSTVYFHLYAWNASATTGRTGIGNVTGNDLVVNGSVAAIPEPRSYWLLLSAAAILLALKLRRRTAGLSLP